MSTHFRIARTLPRFVTPAGGGSLAAWVTAVNADSPWAAWKVDEASGTTFADSSGNTRTMTVSAGTPTLGQTGPGGTASAVLFDGTSNASAHTSATLSTSDVTMETWVRLTAYPASFVDVCVATFDAGGGVFDKTISINPSGNLRFYVYNGSGQVAVTPTALSLNTWYHVACSVGAGGQKIRIDKSTVASNPAVTSSYAGSAMSAYFHDAAGTQNNGNVIWNGDSVIVGPTVLFAAQLSDAQTDAHYDALV